MRCSAWMIAPLLALSVQGASAQPAGRSPVASHQPVGCSACRCARRRAVEDARESFINFLELLVENHRKLDCNRPENQQVVGMDCLAGATRIEMKHLGSELCVPGGPLNTVDKRQTIHRIKNLAEWNEPAVSIHVYSRPIDSCVVFDLDAQRCFRRDLKYDNE